MISKDKKQLLWLVAGFMTYAVVITWVMTAGCSHPTSASIPTAAGVPAGPYPTPSLTPVANPTPVLVYDGEPGSKNLAYGGSWTAPPGWLKEDTSGTQSYAGVGVMNFLMESKGGWWSGFGWNWAGWWTQTKIIDASRHLYLSYWVRGATASVRGDLSISFADANGVGSAGLTINNTAWYSTGKFNPLGTSWVKVMVPLSAWNWKTSDPSKLWEIDISFGQGASFSHIFFVDEMYFYAPPPYISFTPLPLY